MRRLSLRHTVNTRDLGGYPTASGCYTQYSRFLRTDYPGVLEENEVKDFLEKGITTAIDLRSGWEIEHQPSFFRNAPGFTYVHCPFWGNGKPPETEGDISLSYFRMLNDPAIIEKAFRVIIDAPGGVLYHCAAGKDRTGVLSALLLSLAEVAMPDIIADYQVSHTYIQPLLDKLKESDIEIPALAGFSKPEYLMGFFELFFEKYGDARTYMKQLGLTDPEIESIKSKLLD